MKNISVCMAVHNGSAFIQEQINSILPQLKPTDELVISDDNSTDQTLNIIRSFKNPRIKLLNSTEFNSPVKTFEYALSNCRNEIILLADQDDVWHQNKITFMLNELNDCDLCVCDCRIVDKNLNEIASSFFEMNNSGPGMVTNFMRNSFIGCCMGFKRKILTKVLPFPEGIPMHDLWIGLIAEKHFKVKFIPQILVDHRRHENNYSTTASGSRNSMYKKLISRIKLMQLLITR